MEIILFFSKKHLIAFEGKNKCSYKINPARRQNFWFRIIGTFTVATYLYPLDAETMRAILTEPKNALIKQYVRLFELEGIKLTIEEDVLDFMVKKL